MTSSTGRGIRLAPALFRCTLWSTPGVSARSWSRFSTKWAVCEGVKIVAFRAPLWPGPVFIDYLILEERTMRNATWMSITALLVAAVPTAADAQLPADSGAYVARLG